MYFAPKECANIDFWDVNEIHKTKANSQKFKKNLQHQNFLNRNRVVSHLSNSKSHRSSNKQSHEMINDNTHFTQCDEKDMSKNLYFDIY